MSDTLMAAIVAVSRSAELSIVLKAAILATLGLLVARMAGHARASTRGADMNARVWAERVFSQRGGRKEGEWRTPLSMARRGGHDAVVAYLLSVGAQD